MDASGSTPRFLPLELCPAGNWTSTCASDLQETTVSPKAASANKTKKSTKKHKKSRRTITTTAKVSESSAKKTKGLVGYPNGVMPLPSEVFTGSATPAYFGTFAIGRYNDANAWIVDQIVEQARLDGIALQLNAWNSNLDYGGSCYAGASVMSACKTYGSRADQDLIERRLYYDQARWGYSPSVLSWEYINEYPGANLPQLWTGATVNDGGSSKRIPGITSWLESYNNSASPNADSHLITSSCTTGLRHATSCDPVDQVEEHLYASSTPSATAIQSAFLKIDSQCLAQRPCVISEYGMSTNRPADPYTWSSHKGLWLGLASNYSGAWYWWTKEALNTPVNTRVYSPALPALNLASNQAPWNQFASSADPDPYTVLGGISTFLGQWPGTGSSSPHGLDSYSWNAIVATGTRVAADASTTGGLAVDGMVGKSVTDGSINSLIWLVNASSNGGDPSGTDGYPVIPASSVTVSSASSTFAGFAPHAQYLVRWWNTDTGDVVPGLSAVVVAGADGSVTLQVPSVSTDVAATITSTEP